MLSRAQSAAHASGDGYAWLTASIFLNRIQLAHGKLHQAAATCEMIIRQGLQPPIGALAYYDLGWLHHEWNERETAAAWAAEGIQLSSRNDGCDELQAAGCATLARVRLNTRRNAGPPTFAGVLMCTITQLSCTFVQSRL